MEETLAFHEVGVVGCLGWGIRSFSVSSVISVVRTFWLRSAAALGDQCDSWLKDGLVSAEGIWVPACAGMTTLCYMFVRVVCFHRIRPKRDHVSTGQ